MDEYVHSSKRHKLGEKNVYLDAPVRRVTTADVPLPYAPTLINASLPNVPKVIKAVKEVMYRS